MLPDLFDKLNFYIVGASTLIAIGAAIHSYVTSRAMAGKKLIDAVNVRVDGQAKKIVEIESDIDANKKDLSRLNGRIDDMNVSEEVSSIHTRINEVASSTAEQTGQLKQIDNTLNIIVKHLIGGGKE